MKLEIKKLDIRSDDRGFAINILDKKSLKDYDIKEILIIVSKPGAIRGNHYHKTKLEWLGILNGRAKFVYEDNKTGKRKMVTISGNKPKMIRTPRNVTHAVKNVGKDDLYMIELSNQIYEDNPDTFKKQIM
jgi:UDP-2-acetamido-2,6-beta-L-arabino-hexul-4-ose reductase